MKKLTNQPEQIATRRGVDLYPEAQYDRPLLARIRENTLRQFGYAAQAVEVRGRFIVYKSNGKVMV